EEENNFAGRPSDGDVTVLHAGKQVGEFGEFVIVGGEERARASLLLEMFDDGPGDGEAVKSGSAAANFVEEDETRRGRVIEDGRNFAHLNEESGAAASEIVAGANACEDAVGDGEFRLARRDGGAHLRHEDEQSGGAQARGVGSNGGTNVDEKLAFDFDDALVSGEDFAFVSLQLRRSEALGVDQGLLALVIGRSKMQVGLGDFDVVAENLVEADF